MAKVVIPNLTKGPVLRYPPLPPIISPPFGSAVQQKIMEGIRSHRPPPVISPIQKREPNISTQIVLSAHQNPITLVDYDWKPYDTQNRETLSIRKITLPTVPAEVDFNPNPDWAVIASVGRNTPFYHYMGSEDTIGFTIDWYSNQDNREDVIYYCRWLDAKTKADSYGEGPHRVMVQWGTEDKLFNNSLWIVFKAPYKLSQFQKHRSMLPQQAYQEVVLKRVTIYNLSTNEVFNGITRKEQEPTPKPKGI